MSFSSMSLLLCLSCYVSLNSSVGAMADSILDQLQAFEDEHAFLRQFVIPEEDRHRFTSVQWSGEYRWFRSPNVVCIEKLRLLRQRQAHQATAA